MKSADFYDLAYRSQRYNQIKFIKIWLKRWPVEFDCIINFLHHILKGSTNKSLKILIKRKIDVDHTVLQTESESSDYEIYSIYKLEFSELHTSVDHKLWSQSVCSKLERLLRIQNEKFRCNFRSTKNTI